MNNHLVEFLRSGGSLQDLKDKYKLSIKTHKVFSNLLHFSYDQRESPMEDLIVQDARGTVLDQSDNWKIISWSLRKFFRYNEGHAASIDWNSAKVLEKLDGSLINVWNYQGFWYISTTGTPDGLSPSGEMTRDLNSKIADWEPELNARLPVPEHFSHYFWMILKYRFPDLYVKFTSNQVDPNICFSFELMGKYNPVVVRHEKPNAVLIAARNLVSLEEILPKEANSRYLDDLAEVVKEYSLTSLSDIIKSLEILPGLEQEGYVVVDKYFNRNKCKSPSYDALHYMKDQFSAKHFLKLILIGEYSEIIAAFPDYQKEIFELENKYKILIEKLEFQQKIFFGLGLNENRKYFAFAVKDSLCPGLMFALLDNKVSSIREYIQQMKIEKVQELLIK